MPTLMASPYHYQGQRRHLGLPRRSQAPSKFLPGSAPCACRLSWAASASGIRALQRNVLKISGSQKFVTVIRHVMCYGVMGRRRMCSRLVLGTSILMLFVSDRPARAQTEAQRAILRRERSESARLAIQPGRCKRNLACNRSVACGNEAMLIPLR